MWPLIGRDDEYALAIAAIERGDGVVLTGHAGVGKTRLAREFFGHCSRRGGASRTAWIAATHSAAAVPLGAVAHLVPGDAIKPALDATLRGIVDTIEHMGEPTGRLLLGVDDAHLLDDASAALVHLLVSSGVATVVATLRTGETAPDAVVSLWKDGPATLVPLQPLSRDEIHELISTVLEGPLDGGLLHRLCDSSRGIVLYLKELVQHGLETGKLYTDGQLWRWRGEVEGGERLRGLVASRMGTLTRGERRAVEFVALGEPLPAMCLEALGIESMVERLERRGLVTSHRRESVEIGLAHPLYGEVVRADITPRRLDDLRLRLAESLDSRTPTRPVDQMRVALWRADAGDHRRPDQLIVAARRAWALWAAPATERLARAALDAGPELEAGYLLGEALSAQGLASEALEVWTSVERLDGTDAVRAALAVSHSALLNYRFGNPPMADEILGRAAGRLTDADAVRMLDGARAVFATTSLEHTEPTRDGTVDTPLAALAATLDCLTSGELFSAEHVATLWLARTDEWGEQFPSIVLFLELSRLYARILAGDVVEAEAEAEARYAGSLAGHQDYPRLTWCLMRGLVGVLRGRPRSAARTLAEGIGAGAGRDGGWARPMHSYLAMAAALQGDVVTAEEHELLARRADPSYDRIFGAETYRARAWATAATGDVTGALKAARIAVERAQSDANLPLEVLALHDLARFGAPGDACRGLSAVAERVDGPLPAACAAHAAALAAENGSALDDVARQFSVLGLDLFAAEAAVAAAGVHRDQGRRSSAHASARQARQLAERCEAAQTPALLRADRPNHLTRRETDVATLAAAGFASQQIADRLGIARRTVDNLLGRVYVKLGIGGRADLVDVFGRSTARE